MTYTVSAGSPKEAHARRFAAELARALHVRGITKNELGRASGVGHTAIDHYANAAVLPRTMTARAIADALAWPRLFEIVQLSRQGVCKLALCRKPFTNNGGARKLYCSYQCRDVAEKLRLSKTRAAARTRGADARTERAARDNLRGVIREVREERDELRIAVEAMCRSCEPGGVCQTYDCPLRPVSPLPLNDRRIGSGIAQTDFALRSARWDKPGRREAHSARMVEMHASGHPISRSLADYRDNETPEQKEARLAKMRATIHVRRPPPQKEAANGQ